MGGLNLYQDCAANLVCYKDPSGHGFVEQNPYNCYTDVGANSDTANLALEVYLNAMSKSEFVNNTERWATMSRMP